MGGLYERSGFTGAVDLGVHIDGIEEARAGSLFRHWDLGPAFGSPSYRRSERVTTRELHEETRPIVRRLLEPLVEIFSVRGYDIFEDEPH